MVTVDLSQSQTNHSQRLAFALATVGWKGKAAPAHGHLKSNRQLFQLSDSNRSINVRVSIFSIGDRGEEHRRDERRIQITTTFLSGLERLSDYTDIVMGYDAQADVYVGLDARRLEFGGAMHNASSSVDSQALEQATQDTILIRPHETQVLGLEYQAIFRPQRLAEYFFNADLIHRGLYIGEGQFSGTASVEVGSIGISVPTTDAHDDVLVLTTSPNPQKKKIIKKSLITAYENGDLEGLRDLSPSELEAIRRKCAEIGDRGEYFALRFEKQRLRKAGQAALAARVDWISRRHVGKGYDILSFETDGSPRLIEVKSTSGSGMTFFMSDNEWQVAAKEKARYYIYRIVDVDREPRLERIAKDPVACLESKELERIPAGWKVKLLSPKNKNDVRNERTPS